MMLSSVASLDLQPAMLGESAKEFPKRVLALEIVQFYKARVKSNSYATYLEE